MLRQVAYQSFKTALFERTIRPGQFLTQRELCGALNVSVAPMRDALRQLEAEGLVELLPQTGMRVTSVDTRFIRDAFQLRRMLEVQACRGVEDLGSWPANLMIRTESIVTRARNY